VRRAHVYVSGRVQGVFFRQRTVRMARDQGLGGWVRNLPDGRLEAVFEGPADRVERMIEWCRRGPERAVVHEVEVSEEEPEGIQTFGVRR
jgi:acylphosphatase